VIIVKISSSGYKTHANAMQNPADREKKKEGKLRIRVHAVLSRTTKVKKM
jgi:hypothetical protein